MPLIGVEDELIVVGPEDQPAACDFEAAWTALPGSPAWLQREMHAATVELLCDPTPDPAAAVAQLHARRRLLAAHLAPRGQRLLGAGLHPLASPWHAPVHSAVHPHYAALRHEYGDVAQGAMSYGLHLHLGLPSSAQRGQLLRLLRERLPLFMACSANAPYSEGRDTGLASFRHAWLARYPRMGVPPDFASAEAATVHLERLRRAGSVGPQAGLWYDLRLHHRLPTVELRVFDAQGDLRRIESLAAWALAWAWTVEQGRAPDLSDATPTPLLEENHWRARRHGRAARLVDWCCDREQAVDAALGAEAEHLAPALQALGGRAAFERLLSDPEPAAEQRRWQAEGGWTGLIDALAAQALQPC